MKHRNEITAGPIAVTAEQLEAELLRGRQAEAVRRTDELERLAAEAGHTRSIADVDEDARRAELDRAEREEIDSDRAELARMYRKARAAGERIRVTSQMARSGEARALRLERLRNLNLKVLVPVLLGFAAWSTTGVHDGAGRLMAVNSLHQAMWWALWALEPVLIGAVVWVTIVRARLAASGGRIAAKAVQLAAGCLSVSIALNLAAGAPLHPPGSLAAWCAAAAAMLAHVIGPAGAAATAHLIGVIDESIAEADPWTQDGRAVPLLEEMDLQMPAPTPVRVPVQTPAIATGPAREPEMFSDTELKTWLNGDEPPEEGLASTGSPADDDGPEGAAKPLPRPVVDPLRRGSHIDPDQRRGDETPQVSHRRQTRGSNRVDPAARARRSAGDETFRRVSDHMAAHPDDTVAQICTALGLSRATVMRHRRTLKENA